MNIRRATAADVPQVLPMVAAIAALHEAWDPAKFGYLPHPENRYQTWLTGRTRDDRGVFLVAEREPRAAEPAKLVGFLVATVEQEIPIYRVKEFGFIHDIWVDDAYRHEGVGRQLVMLAIERFRQIGVPQVRADTAARNDAARGLMAKCGMRPSTTEMLVEL